MEKLGTYLRKHLCNMSAQLVYAALLLYYAFKQPDIPRWAKSSIVGAIGYLLSPIDSIPDLTPFIGFTDDFGVIMFALVTIACYINDEVRIEAKEKVESLLPKVDTRIFAIVDKRL